MSEPLYVAHAYSHAGHVRPDNQDSTHISLPTDQRVLQSQGALFAIADGMGGYEHGGVASTLALETFAQTFYGSSSTRLPQTMRQSIEAANLAIYQAAQRMGARMGTTLSAASIVGNQLHLAHIGDSRVYLVRGRKPACLTNDHTAVGELVRLKVLSPDKVRTHERRSVLEKSLGIQLFVQPDISTHVVCEGDTLILCTDGVWAYVQDDEFARIARDASDPDRISQALIDLALERNSDDNVSALVVHVQRLAPAPAVEPAGRRSGLTQLIRARLGRA